MTAISSVAFLPPAAAGLLRHVPPAGSIVALATLGVVKPVSRTGCSTC